jgi:DNA-binding NtrC family response regulator
MNHLLTTSTTHGGRFLASQALSSAQMVRHIVLDEMRRGDFSNLSERVERIDHLVREGLLVRADEHGLTLLAAQFLEAAGEPKRAFRLTGQLLADEDTLGEHLLADLRRFRTRQLLNIGSIEDARAEVNRIERVVLCKDELLGESVEAVEADDSLVSVPTWLLTAEVCLSEKNSAEAIAALRFAVERMKREGQSAEDATMFELLSALSCFQLGDDEGIPALAYLYRAHVVLQSGIDAAIGARIAAAAGDMERTVGLSRNEVARWRGYGPERSLLSRYLNEGGGVVPPPDLLKRIMPEGGAAEPEVTLVANRSELGDEFEAARQVAAQSRNVNGLPLSFEFEAFGLEEISSMFDFSMKTGPLVIDWSKCDSSVIEEAIAAGAICEQARDFTSGIIYFNNGSYVDARFNGLAGEDSGAAVLETIFELFRISMARLPGAFGYQAAAGALAARVPEITNLRPNKTNFDLMKRLDHLRSGIAEVEDENIDALFEAWTEPQTTAVATSSISVVHVPADSGFVSKLGALMEASEVEEIAALARAALSSLDFVDPKIDFFVTGLSGSMVEAGAEESYAIVDECSSGIVTARLSLAQPSAIACPGAVRALLNACAQRVRTLSGTKVEGVIQVNEFVAVDPVTQSLLSSLRDFAALDGTSEGRRLRHILLLGERGVGKEILAHLIHKWSGRAEHAFNAVHFGTISNELAAAELFGSKRGSYSGSVEDRPGLIQHTGAGTLFLDELDEASGTVQAMIKRVVQLGVFNIVGDPRESKSNARFIAATNVVDVESQAIKEDLKDRFLVLRVPPLRERRGDIRPLAERFALEYGKVLPEPVLVFLERLNWPGNVRQLENVIERSCAAARDASDLTIDLVQHSAMEAGAVVSVSHQIGDGFVPLITGETLEMRLKAEEKKHVLFALESCKGIRTHAAAVLGLTRQTLLARMKAHGVRTSTE